MKQEQVAAKVPAKDNEPEKNATVVVNFPETIEEAKSWCGEEALLSNAFSNWKVTLQSNIRSGLKRGETPEQIQERLSNAVMGVAQTGPKVDAQTAFLAKFKSATPDEQKKLIQELRKMAQA